MIPLESSDSSDINIAANLIKSGELVAFPTETVYGLGADATNDMAVHKIFTAKGRPTVNPLIVHISADSDPERWIELPNNSRVKEQFLKLNHFWPGPLTIVFPQTKPSISPLVTAGRESLGLRVPSNNIAQELLKNSGLPIAAPSANKSNYVSATTAAHVRSCFGAKLFILDGGPTQIGIESTIVALSDNGLVKLLRHGIITETELTSSLGEDIEDCVPIGQVRNPLSPGQFPRHYSPKTPLMVFKNYPAFDSAIQIGVVNFTNPQNGSNKISYQHQIVLSNSGDVAEAARNLYDTLRKMDDMGLDLILVEEPPPQGIGRALIDRLFRASYSEEL